LFVAGYNYKKQREKLEFFPLLFILVVQQKVMKNATVKLDNSVCLVQSVIV